MTRRKSILRFFVLPLGALAVGLPATAALAAEPTTAPEAQALADKYREQADNYRALGGVGYKTGIVQSAEANAAKYAAVSDQLSNPAAAAPVPSSEAQALADKYREQADNYRALGGVGYKTGIVQSAEANAAKYAAVSDQLSNPAAAAPVPSPEAQHYANLAGQYRSLGGVGYKTGAVQRAEAEQRMYEAPPATACPYTNPTVVVACNW